MERKKLEILAPAGSFESLKAAIAAGADAVYMGGNKFGARAYADNPQGEVLLEAIDYAHLHGVKLYLTINTLLKEKELENELYEYLKPCYERGLDAVIVQDLGVLCAIRKWFPDLDIHASTQMTLCGADSATFLESLNIQRIVLSRELSLTEISQIHKNTNLEIECFVHGALCYSYSGQCLFSSILGGRSGNRGRCAQPCRLNYDAVSNGKIISKKGENALLSPKDICTLDLLPKLAKAGIYSLKIEGRMKRPEYAAGVVRIYRKYVDKYLKGEDYQVSDADRRELLLLFNRDGFSKGYYEQQNGRNMMALWDKEASDSEKREYEVLIRNLQEQYVNTEKKISISGKFYAKEEEPICLTLQHKNIQITVYGDIAQKAKNRPMEVEQIKKQLNKLGNTSFLWEHLEVKLDGQLFIPVQALNQLRREALTKIQEALLESHRRDAVSFQSRKNWKNEKTTETELHISVQTKEQLKAILKETETLKQKEQIFTTVYLEAQALEEQLPELIVQIHEKDLKAYVLLPTIFRMKTQRRYEEKLSFWKNLDADAYVLKNIEEYQFFKEKLGNVTFVLDHNLYTWNQSSREFWESKDVHFYTNPLELNVKELKELSGKNSIQIIYGRYPMMTTAGCLHKTLNQCQKKEELWFLRDRYHKEFPVRNYCRDCYNVIYNSQPLYLLDQKEQLASLGVGAWRMMFTTEDFEETLDVLKQFESDNMTAIDFTRGHFKRGVE